MSGNTQVPARTGIEPAGDDLAIDCEIARDDPAGREGEPRRTPVDRNQSIERKEFDECDAIRGLDTAGKVHLAGEELRELLDRGVVACAAGIALQVDLVDASTPFDSEGGERRRARRGGIRIDREYGPELRR
jgi:hypothetical protein